MYVGTYERGIRNVKSINVKFYSMRCLVMFITAVCLLFLLKICVLDLRWRCFVNFSCGDAVFVNFFCGVAVFRTPPCPPPLMQEHISALLNVPKRPWQCLFKWASRFWRPTAWRWRLRGSQWEWVWRRKQLKCIGWSKTLTDIIWQNGVQAESLRPLTLRVFVFLPLDWNNGRRPRLKLSNWTIRPLCIDQSACSRFRRYVSLL